MQVQGSKQGKLEALKLSPSSYSVATVIGALKWCFNAGFFQNYILELPLASLRSITQINKFNHKKGIDSTKYEWIVQNLYV